MSVTSSIARRVGLPVAGAAAALMACLLMPATAGAEPSDAPNCTAADLAGVSAGVAASVSAYLFTHPDVNDFYTSLRGQPRDQMAGAVRTFFDANPQAHSDLLGIRQPLVDFRSRCGMSEPDQPLLGQ
jgi:hemophore-related protein